MLKTKENDLDSVQIKAVPMAAGEGFEPSHTESESAVLPLHNPAKRKSYYTQNREKVKSFFTFFRESWHIIPGYATIAG